MTAHQKAIEAAGLALWERAQDYAPRRILAEFESDARAAVIAFLKALPFARDVGPRSFLMTADGFRDTLIRELESDR